MHSSYHCEDEDECNLDQSYTDNNFLSISQPRAPAAFKSISCSPKTPSKISPYKTPGAKKGQRRIEKITTSVINPKSSSSTNNFSTPNFVANPENSTALELERQRDLFLADYSEMPRVIKKLFANKRIRDLRNKNKSLPIDSKLRSLFLPELINGGWDYSFDKCPELITMITILDAVEGQEREPTAEMRRQKILPTTPKKAKSIKAHMRSPFLFMEQYKLLKRNERFDPSFCTNGRLLSFVLSFEQYLREMHARDKYNFKQIGLFKSNFICASRKMEIH